MPNDRHIVTLRISISWIFEIYITIETILFLFPKDINQWLIFFLAPEITFPHLLYTIVQDVR